MRGVCSTYVRTVHDRLAILPNDNGVMMYK